MVEEKTIAPEVRACGAVFLALTTKLNAIGQLAESVTDEAEDTFKLAALEAIQALAYQAAALADSAAVAAGDGCGFGAESWMFGDKLPLIAEIRGGATDAQRGAQ